MEDGWQGRGERRGDKKEGRGGVTGVQEGGVTREEGRGGVTGVRGGRGREGKGDRVEGREG